MALLLKHGLLFLNLEHQPFLFSLSQCQQQLGACKGHLPSASSELGLPRWHSGEESACQCKRCGFSTWVRKIHGSPLQCSCLENSMDRGAWWPAVPGSQRVRHNLVTEPTHTAEMKPPVPAAADLQHTLKAVRGGE